MYVYPESFHHRMHRHIHGSTHVGQQAARAAVRVLNRMPDVSGLSESAKKLLRGPLQKFR